jgi:NTE family protein
MLAYLGEPGLGDWTRICLERSDQVMLVITGEAPATGLSPLEKLAAEMFPPARRRLVRLHPRRLGVVSGTAGWLARMEVAIHHHVSLEDDTDLLALSRFLTGQAVGFVAGGGGGYGPAHVGIYRAFRERGVTFDAFVGTSVGSAMLAGFAFLGEHDALTAGTEDIFVRSRSFKRPTLPRYSLLDHKVFDEALARAYGSTTMVEDCWKPFCAVATNLSAQRIELIRTGLLWQAVRASSAIPCILPPFYTKDGTMLVDGGLMDDAPLAPMKSLKDGPNLVVHFGRTGESRFDVDYDSLPGRSQLLASLINPRARMPRAPKIMNVLFRSLLAHQRYDLPVDEHDLVLTPPSLPGASLMSFDRHMEVFNAAHAWGKEEIERRTGAADPAVRAILSGAGADANGEGLVRAA